MLGSDIKTRTRVCGGGWCEAGEMGERHGMVPDAYGSLASWQPDHFHGHARQVKPRTQSQRALRNTWVSCTRSSKYGPNTIHLMLVSYYSYCWL